MRIMVGVLEIAGQIPVYADGFRALGHEVTTVVRHKIPWWQTEYTYELNPEILTLDDAMLIGYILGSHDVFVYEWAREGLLPQAREIGFINSIGKRAVSIFQGSDVRYYPAYQEWYSVEQRHLSQIPFPPQPVSNCIRALRYAELHCNLILSLQNQSVMAVRPYMHSFLPMRLKDYPFHIPGRDIPVVVHAPSRKQMKGSNIIERALDNLKAQGVPFEWQVLHNVSNDDVINSLINADVAIDQIYFPLHGKFALEAMACGCAVANNEREEYEPFPPNRPIWHIDYENIENQLRVLLTNKELRIKLAQAGRYYVEKMHDHVGVANRMLHLLYPSDDLIYDYHPDFYYHGFNLPAGEVIDDDILEQTAEIIQKWGLPDDVSLEEIVQRKLVSKKLLEYAVPRWQKELAAPKHTINDFISTPATPQWVEERSQPITAHPKKDDLALRLADAISALNEGDKETANKILKAAVNKYPQRVEAWAAYASSYKI